MAQIILLVEPDGNSEMIVKGSPGASCRSVSEFLSSELGTVSSDTPTEEYYCETQVQETENNTHQQVRRLTQ